MSNSNTTANLNTNINLTTDSSGQLYIGDNTDPNNKVSNKI